MARLVSSKASTTAQTKEKERCIDEIDKEQQEVRDSESNHSEVESEGDDDDEGDSEASAGVDDEVNPASDDEEENTAYDDEEEIGTVGFGDAMSKILQQNVGEDAQPILAKRTTARMREIQNVKSETKKERISAQERRAKERKDNILPSHAGSAKDRQLRKVATKGVVALFNAIAKHQHHVGKSADKEDKKVKELSKEHFLDLLKASNGDAKAVAASVSSTTPSTALKASTSSWSVLQDDFMMDAKKLKDWDATHKTTSRKSRREGVNDDDSDPEATEDKAWKQAAATLDSDEEDVSKKRKHTQSRNAPKKRVKN